MTAPFLITGCGRSGTAWAAALFTELGYPCGHEVQFAYDRTAPLTASEPSWPPIPHLDALPPPPAALRLRRGPTGSVLSVLSQGSLPDGHGTRHPPYVSRTRPHL